MRSLSLALCMTSTLTATDIFSELRKSNFLCSNPNFISYGRAVRRSHMAGWCNGSTSRSERETVGSNPNPATKTDVTSVIRCRERWWRSEKKAAVFL
ncbi:protein B [Uncultured phage WW-nAnB strain 3]|uniref:protein B n=1 Tax=Uncultured phage WW-nAnB strain 3 TaxID=1449897 RepID=UPI0003E383AE|nr:protein B [Uncultured phage WW-nAnB strain 3]AHH02853.1 protein B [Uncultured phage WW-nAnB strain 3]